MAPLQILADASGNTLSPQGVPISTTVELPWMYAYAWPSDAVAARWMPWNYLTVPPQSPPQTTGTQTLLPGQSPLVPARFLVSTSSQYLTQTGAPPGWDQIPDIEDVEGLGRFAQRVILTDVPQAQFVYTMLSLEPDLWDDLFQEAFVALLASRLAMRALVDGSASPDVQAKQRGAAAVIRNQQIALAKDAIASARTVSANEAGFPQSVNYEAIWMRARTGGTRSWGGPWGYGPWGGPGYAYCGWGTIGFSDGSVF